MSTVARSISIDEEIMPRFDEIAASIGVSSSSAFNVFARKFVAVGGFPFDVRAEPEFEFFETEKEAGDFTTAGLRRAVDEAR